MSKTYRVNEIFLSIQGEGIRAGTANVFVRFSGCNLKCNGEILNQPVCDTEFASGRTLTLPEIEKWVEEMVEISKGINPYWLILTGGEPGLQVDQEFCNHFHSRGYKLAIETNGTVELPWLPSLVGGKGPETEKRYQLDWITLSPKVAEHAVKQLVASEIKYVRGLGQGIPKPVATAEHYLISPAADGNEIHPKTIQWCIRLCLENPQWRLSCQQHKIWVVR